MNWQIFVTSSELMNLRSEYQWLMASQKKRHPDTMHLLVEIHISYVVFKKKRGGGWNWILTKPLNLTTNSQRTENLVIWQHMKQSDKQILEYEDLQHKRCISSTNRLQGQKKKKMEGEFKV